MASGFPTLLHKEILRFSRVGFQTVAAPVLTAVLYLFVFSHALSRHVDVYPGVTYTAFLVPGLVMMSMVQNAFANASSSLIQSKITGNLIFILLPPISYFEFFMAYLLASILRGLLVGASVWLATLFFVDAQVYSWLWLLAFAVLGTSILACFGILAGIWADKFDQLAAFQNFLIMPLTFLSGVFYSIHNLPPFWFELSKFNPVFYMIDGIRFGFFGVSDVPPWHSFTVVLNSFALLALLTMALLKSGYKLRNKG